MSSVHGHEVMQMMIEQGGQFTKASLKQAIEAKFGADARFHTCKAEDLDADGIIEFLEQRGKFIASDAGFNTAPEKICNH